MLRVIALSWPLLRPRHRVEVCARVAWLLLVQGLWLLLSLEAAAVAALAALWPVSLLLDAAQGAAASLLFVPMAVLAAVMSVVANATGTRLRHRHRRAVELLARRFARLPAPGRTVGGNLTSAVVPRAALAPRLGPARQAGPHPSRSVSLLLALSGLGVVAGFAPLGADATTGCRARQSEARTALVVVQRAERAWHDAHGGWLNLEGLVQRGGVDERTLHGSRFYGFSVKADASGFEAAAVDRRAPIRPGAGLVDAWRVDASGDAPRHVLDACD